MDITIVDEVKNIKKKDSEEYEKIVVNKIIGHPNHKGRILHHTADELREMKTNMDKLIKEMDSNGV